MRLPHLPHAAAGLLLAALPLAAQPLVGQGTPTLKVGDPAPPLTIASWVKGDAVPEFQEGKAYVVEFWATWCGPCIASMPHLSHLQAEHGAHGLTVIGVTTEDQNNSLAAVERMVEAKGDVMGYTVAWDEGQATNQAWMKAAGRRGIPSSFLVDGKGNVAWIGHPSMLDLPIELVLAGDWDYVKGPALVEQVYAERGAIAKLVGSDPAEALRRFDAFAKEHPKLAAGMRSLHFDILVRLPERRDEARRLGGTLVDEAVAAKDSGALNALAWNLVDPEVELADRLLDVALRAADKANSLTGEKDAAILDTLARVHFWKGDYAAALRIQQRAVEHAEGRMKEALEPALEEYREALDAKRAG